MDMYNIVLRLEDMDFTSFQKDYTQYPFSTDQKEFPQNPSLKKYLGEPRMDEFGNKSN